METNNTLREMSSLLKVPGSSLLNRRSTDLDTEGLDEPLFQRLVTSAAEPFLQKLQELFVNIWGSSNLKPFCSDMTGCAY